jgi:hypothetical protein
VDKGIRLLTASDVLLAEADDLLSKGDVVQASEKYYKAAEEAVKLLVKSLNLQEILEKVKEDKTWKSSTLFRSAKAIARQLGNNEVAKVWRVAWYVRVLGFHEMKLTRERLTELSSVIHGIKRFLD